MTTPEPSMPAAYDVLGSPEPARRTRRLGSLAVGLVGAGALAVAGSAVAVAALLGGGGAQPEDVLPADALGLVTLDLDPAAGQKVAVYRLAKRFPAVAREVKDEDGVKDQLLTALLGDAGDLDDEKDVKPWIGDRVGAALVPGAEEPQPLVAIAYTDREEAEAALRSDAFGGGDETFFAFSAKADYVLVGSSQETVDAAAEGEQVLADSPAWGEGVDALDGDQIVTVWADLGAVHDALPQEARDEAAQAYGLETDVALGGTFVAGLHVGDDHVEVVGKALDLESPFQVEQPVGGGKGSGLVQDLPEDTIGALSVTHLGSGLAELFGTVYGDEDPLGIVATARELGLDLPDDLRALLGDETVAAALSERDFVLQTRSEDPDAAYAVWEKVTALASGQGPASVLRKTEDGVVVGSNPEALQRVEDGRGLGDSDVFREAVPDAEDAGYLLYVDLARALELAGQDVPEDAEPLQALGISGSGDDDSSTFRMRLTVKGER
ncbi:MAG: hypothetical protein JWM62_2622 [Frankiales bacterium]|jgi:hypothetical protein|nr:hypothetical protein [Frankiales bacterium]